MLDEDQIQKLLKAAEPECPEVDRDDLVSMITTRQLTPVKRGRSLMRPRVLLAIALASAASLVAVASIPKKSVPQTPAIAQTDETNTDDQYLAELESRYEEFRTQAENTQTEVSQLLAQIRTGNRLGGEDIIALESSAKQAHASEALWLASGELQNPQLKSELLVSISRLYPDSDAATRFTNTDFHQ